MTDHEKIQTLNAQLSGANTSLAEMVMVFFVLLIIGALIFALVVTFFDDKKSDSEEQDRKRKEAMKKILSRALMFTGLAATLYAIVLVLGM